MHINKKILTLAVILCVVGITHADPLVFLKNNSTRYISVEPLATNTTFEPASIAPEKEYKVEKAGASITGLRIHYCPNTATACNTDEVEFYKATKKSTTFYFDAPKAKKYYVKLTIDKNDKVSLEAQKGVLGRTSDMKYTLSDNIQTAEIKNTPARPQQAAPIVPKAPKIGLSSPTMPMMEQEAVLDTNIDWHTVISADKQLQEIQTELKNIQLLATKKDVRRSDLDGMEARFNKSTKRYSDLKKDIAQAHYQLTSAETALAKEVDNTFTKTKDAIAKLKDFLKITSGSSHSPETTTSTLPSEDALSTAERQQVLGGIKTLAPALYELIIKEDPTGEKHITLEKFGRGMSVQPSWVTGLPVITVEREILNQPWGEIVFTLGHELSHYLLGHSLEIYYDEQPSENIMKQARQRIRENECDRMSVMEFGTNIDDGIAHHQHIINKRREYTLDQPHKQTFKEDHSLSADRIKYLEALRPEADLNKAHKNQRSQIDWKKIVEDYKNAGKPQPVDASLVQKYVNKTYERADLDRYVNLVALKYKNIGRINYFAQSDKDDRGKPWTLENIADFLSDNLYEVDKAIKEKVLTYEHHENRVAADILCTYYNAKLLGLKFPGNKEAQAITKGSLEELLNTPIVGKSAAYIIQKFEQ